jgi:hypothetical protein
MGGLLFGTPRKPLDEFNKYRKHIESLMKHHNINYKIPLYYRYKKDFGDLDVLIKKTVPTSKLLSIFNNCECHYDKSESCVSFNYKDFQIDFIRIEPNDLEIAYHYFSYNDLGNLIGQLAKANGLKYGFDGLKFNYYIKGQLKGSISISKNIDEILTFLDLDPIKFHKGFNAIEEVFDYVIASKYFNPYVFDLEPYAFSDTGVALYRINKINRERNVKRKTYQEWLKYVDKYKTGQEKYKFREDYDINEIYNRIDKFFPHVNFKEKIKFFDIQEEERKRVKTKFNGGLIIDILPSLKKEDRQFFIDSFKENIVKKHGNFDSYIVRTSNEKIEKDIEEFFKIFNKKYNNS